MQNLHNDNNLDDLSRKAADQFEPDQGLHSWEKLQSRLDKELPVKKEKKRRYLFIFLFFLLVGGGVIFSAIWSNRNAGISSTPISAGNHPSAANGAGLKSVDSKKQSPVPISSKPATEQPVAAVSPDQANVEPTDRLRETGIQGPAEQQVDQEVTSRSRRTVQNQPAPVRRISDSNSDDVQVLSGSKQEANKNIPTNENVAGKISTDKPREQVVTSAANTEARKITELPSDPLPGIQDSTAAEINPSLSKPAAALPVTENTDHKTAEVITSPRKNKAQPSVSASKWEFGLTYAPDLSTVKFTHTQKPGTNVGLMVGYNISRRFSVHAGALYTIKNYKSRGKDYHPPKGYWTDYVKLETVTADCNMWDLPINLRYNFIPRKSSNLFASAGLSSYLMRKEDYEFSYYYNGIPANRYRSYETESKHWLSVLNLSIGYERQLTRNLSLQAEPFFKQPLKGVGFGNVKLNSTGVFLSVKYKPSYHNNRK